MRTLLIIFIILATTSPDEGQRSGLEDLRRMQPQGFKYGTIHEVKDTTHEKQYYTLIESFRGDSADYKQVKNDIRLELLSYLIYRIDLASVVNKYIGETEKNLSKLFKQAEIDDLILVFNEADALFGRRTSGEDNHDKYVCYVLKQLFERSGSSYEDHPELNLKKLFDENEKLIADLNEVHENQSREMATIENNKYVLHGRILDGSFKGIKDIKIDLGYETNPEPPISPLIYTDETGYFFVELNFAPTRHNRDIRRSVESGLDRITKDDSATGVNPELFISIWDGKNRIFSYNTPFEPIPGLNDYIEIVLK